MQAVRVWQMATEFTFPITYERSFRLAVGFLLSTSVWPHRMDEQGNSSSNGQALDEKSIRD
jgi:hypothetical protein